MRHATSRFWRQPLFWITLVLAWVVIAVALRVLERVSAPTTVWYSDQWIVHPAMYALAFAGAWIAARTVASKKQADTARGFEVVSEKSGGPRAGDS